MRRRKPPTWLTIIPAALMMTGHWDAASGATLPQPPQQQEQSQRSRYADGVYTAKGQYGDLPSFIVVTVTLKNSVITAVQVTPQATVPESLERQRSFAAAAPKMVLGKPIDQVRVGKLAGSSGTPRGFNDAIQKIKQQAAS